MFVILSCLKALPCQALEGCAYIDFVIHGETIHSPIPNKDVMQDFYMLKRALNGDETSREILLGGKKERWLFIGDMSPVWAVITHDDIKVVIP